MQIFLITFGVFLVVVVAMAIGYIYFYTIFLS